MPKGSVVAMTANQTIALTNYLRKTMGTSIDELVEEIGFEDAMTMVQLKQRLEGHVEKLEAPKKGKK